MRPWNLALFAATFVIAGCTRPQAVDDAGRDAEAAPDTSIPEQDAATLPEDGGTDAATLPEDGGTDAATLPEDGGTDAAVTMVDIGGTVVGLPNGVSLRLGNGAVMRDVTGTATTPTFSFQVPMGASYDIAITTAPGTLLCEVYRGSGTASASVTNVFVGCSTAVDLHAWFPFDGDAHAMRGADWTSMTGTVAYTTDRIGRTGHALDATPAATDYRLDHALDGRSTVAPQGTQLTVSLWARIPAAVSTTTTQNLFEHLGPGSQSVAVQINWRSAMPYFDFYFYWDGGFSMVLTSSTSALDRDHWHHVAIAAAGPASAVVGGPQFVRSIYVDGVREGTTTTCCGWGNSTTYWHLGQSAIQRDDVRVYTRMLTDAEIAGIYAAEHVP